MLRYVQTIAAYTPPARPDMLLTLSDETKSIAERNAEINARRLSRASNGGKLTVRAALFSAQNESNLGARK